MFDNQKETSTHQVKKGGDIKEIKTPSSGFKDVEDIAVIKLAKPFKKSPHVEKINICNDEENDNQYGLLLTGFGTDADNPSKDPSTNSFSTIFVLTPKTWSENNRFTEL